MADMANYWLIEFWQKFGAQHRTQVSLNLPSIGHGKIAAERTTAGFSGWGICRTQIAT